MRRMLFVNEGKEWVDNILVGVSKRMKIIFVKHK